MASSTVLLVEDNPVNLQLARFLLEAAGFQVHAADSAPVALDSATRLLPDLILMDVELPGMDGLEATRHLKEDPRTAHIPIVALTANAMHGDRELCLEAGCAGYITKPIDTHDFASQVRGYLGVEAN